MRQTIIAGNWKMNLSKKEAMSLIKRLKEQRDVNEKIVMAIYVPAIHIPVATNHLKDMFKIGAQNVYKEQSGAFTGEISPRMTKSYDCDSVLIGHSERRSFFNEKNDLLKAKVDACLAEDLHVMFCIGETLEDRESGHAEDVIQQQLEESVFHLSEEQFLRLSIAYEPVWAIGTGKAATPNQAQTMHAYIRKLITEKYNESVAENTAILYGGSVKPSNAKEIFDNKDIDGGLIGGASLIADDFYAIVDAI